MLLELQSTIIYGPIQSRRIGSSLGVNLLPPKIKGCSFDCLYCQYSWTDFSLMENAEFPKAEEVRKALEAALEERPGRSHPTAAPRQASLSSRWWRGSLRGSMPHSTGIPSGLSPLLSGLYPGVGILIIPAPLFS